jgi:hypothetical protein
MYNLTRQARAATDLAVNAAGRFAGKELLKFGNDETAANVVNFDTIVFC